MDFKSDWNRKKASLGAEGGWNFFTTLVEFFTLDVFNSLEIFSIGISSISLGIFIMWLANESQFASKLVGNYSDFVDYASTLRNSALIYNELSSLNMLIIFVRPLKFMRENPRMAKLNQTLWEALPDIFWFVVMLAIVLFGFVMFAYVSFGSHNTKLSSLYQALNYCFNYIIGIFDYHELEEADPVMAGIFFFPYLLLFYCVFMNIFFAIIDRFFINAEPPPFNFKRKFKPFFGRICRCIEWDEDYMMEEGKNKTTPLRSRRGRVHETAMKIQDIKEKGKDNIYDKDQPTKAKFLKEVCDMDDRMAEVDRWSKEESKRFVENFQKMFSQRQDQKTNSEQFVKNVVVPTVMKEQQEEEKLMDEAKRNMKYATKVHEKMSQRDQETLAKYILLLEEKIKKKMVEKHALSVEVKHLKAESETMRFTEQERKTHESKPGFSEMERFEQVQQPEALQDGTAPVAEEEEAETEEDVSDSDNEGGGGGTEGNGTYSKDVRRDGMVKFLSDKYFS